MLANVVASARSVTSGLWHLARVHYLILLNCFLIACIDEHWKIKRALSHKMSNPAFDALYAAAKRARALGFGRRARVY